MVLRNANGFIDGLTLLESSRELRQKIGVLRNADGFTEKYKSTGDFQKPWVKNKGAEKCQWIHRLT